MPSLPAGLKSELSRFNVTPVVELDSDLLAYGVLLPEYEGQRLFAVGYATSRSDSRPSELVIAAAEVGWSEEHLDEWLAQLPVCAPEILKALLQRAGEQLERRGWEDALQADIEQLSRHIDHTYEEISLLHALTSNMQISGSPVQIAELCVDRLYGLIPAAGNVIVLDGDASSKRLVQSGSLPLDERQLMQLIASCEAHDWSMPLVKNRVEASQLGTDFPGLKSFVLVAIAEGVHRSGWLLSCNCTGGGEFGTVEASLLNSVASILGTHMRNIDLYRQHEELLISFVRSLVSTLDAKDPYTRGHSERVAMISQCLGRAMNLPEEELRDIYLAGLLHDIGKIGINDSILQKPSGLTDEEFKRIQVHPILGYEILSDLKNLQRVLPGVRSHHETYSGHGYPDRLQGEDIPLMARILAVADAYDAMGSDRPYRAGMPLEAIERIFRRGAGDQWDAKVLDVYFQVRDDVARICREYSFGDGDPRKQYPALVAQ